MIGKLFNLKHTILQSYNQFIFHMRILITLFILSIITLGCENQNATAILGSWNCSEILEEGKALEIDISTIKFSFDEAGQYTYQGNLKYKEAGNYHLVGDKLYTTDTIDNTAVEKVVRIILLNNDSMHFKMNVAGNEQIMKLARAN